MRIKAIALSWFRGAADPVSMEPNCRSMVVYGTNASGKSSFVDAVEFLLNGGRIGHLAHEYSGKHLKNAIHNTHKPKGAKTELSIKLCDDSGITMEIKEDGTTNASGSIGVWDYRRTVLRQDEVAAFIHETKGGKYSALLPLFGLHPMEIAAENLRQLAKNVASLCQLEQSKATLGQINERRRAAFGSDTDEQILKKIEALHDRYCPDQVVSGALSRCANLTASLQARVSDLSADQKRYLILRTVAEIEITSHIRAVRSATATIADAVDPLVSQKIAMLQPTEAFVANLTAATDVVCPACGQSIPADVFRQHVKTELERLRDLRQTFNSRNAAMAGLSDALKSLKLKLAKSDIKGWCDALAKGSLVESLTFLTALNPEVFRTVCAEADLQQIEGKLVQLVDAAISASVNAPPDVQQLLETKRTIETARDVVRAADQEIQLRRGESLFALIGALEQAIREEIRLHSQAVIDEISEDIRRMWSTLHPEEAIDDVHLYLPKDADKAIDIGLKFHGKELESPRITLSEGYRNSLGLCIFLAMAKRGASSDGPILLDDVVVSLDRGHRGMIVELLEKEFSGRQVIILTHDRDWYTDLRQQLDKRTWTFKVLVPYENPKIGIRWAHKTTTFEDARAQLPTRPDSAGNDARKIMDAELAMIAERLQIRLPYLRFEKNDRRLAHEFLERIGASAKKCFQKKISVDFVTHTDAIQTLSAADSLLLSWGNRASHSFDVVRPEAKKLIDLCEKALEVFRCVTCGKPIWFADSQASEWLQCHCGEIRWRYGKE